MNQFKVFKVTNREFAITDSQNLVAEKNTLMIRALNATVFKISQRFIVP
jgi:hypothetical protein